MQEVYGVLRMRNVQHRQQQCQFCLVTAGRWYGTYVASLGGRRLSTCRCQLDVHICNMYRDTYSIYYMWGKVNTYTFLELKISRSPYPEG